MKNLILILILATSLSLLAQKEGDEDKTKNKFGLNIGYDRFSASSYFDREGELVDDRIQDSVLIDTNGVAYSREFFSTFNRNTVDIRFVYSLNKNFEFYLASPLHIYSFQSQYKADSLAGSTEKDDFGLTQFEHLIVGGIIDDIMIKKIPWFQPSFMYELRLAYGDYDGLTGDPDYPEFLGDNATQFLGGTNLGFRFEKVGFDLGYTYHYLAEDFSDRMIYHAGFTLYTVETTQLGAFVDYHTAVDPIPEDIVFNLTNFQPVEEWLDLGFKFGIDFNETWDADLFYSVKIDGRNTWRGGRFGISTKFLFNTL